MNGIFINDLSSNNSSLFDEIKSRSVVLNKFRQFEELCLFLMNPKVDAQEKKKVLGEVERILGIEESTDNKNFLSYLKDLIGSNITAFVGQFNQRVSQALDLTTSLKPEERNLPTSYGKDILDMFVETENLQLFNNVGIVDILEYLLNYEDEEQRLTLLKRIFRGNDIIIEDGEAEIIINFIQKFESEANKKEALKTITGSEEELSSYIINETTRSVDKNKYVDITSGEKVSPIKEDELPYSSYETFELDAFIESGNYTAFNNMSMIDVLGYLLNYEGEEQRFALLKKIFEVNNIIIENGEAEFITNFIQSFTKEEDRANVMNILFGEIDIKEAV